MTDLRKTITTALETIFVEADATVLTASIAWAAERVAAIKAFNNDPEMIELRKDRNIDQYGYRGFYGKRWAVAGGKTWYNVFHGRNAEMINEFMTKNCAATAEKRNANIVKKMIKAGVTEILSSDYIKTSDGFTGTFRFNTDAGEKVCTIRTIWAGGYNIQCLHMRILVRVS